MKVYVVMGNDYPDSAFNSAENAEKYIAEKKAIDTEQREHYLRQHMHRPGIYWRWYEFEVQP